MNNQEMLRLLLFGANSAALLSFYLKYQMYSQMLKDILPLPIQKWKEYLKNMDNKGYVLFKDQLKHPSKQFRSSFDVGSNMVFFNSIPLPKYRHTHYSLMMNQHLWKVKLKQFPGQVNIPLMSDSKIINTISYSYNSIFDSKEKPGLFGTIFKYTLATVAVVADFVLSLLANNRRSIQPIIDGPTWGTLTMISQIIVDKPFVLLCKIEGNSLLPMFAGLNKKDIQQWLQDSKSKQMWFMMITLFFLYKTRAPFVRIVREICKAFTAQVKRLMMPAPIMKEYEVKDYQVKVGDEQCCIICYNRCRNLIIRKCRHLILCDSCVHQNAIKSCPMCRVDIEDDDLIKVVAYKE